MSEQVTREDTIECFRELAVNGTYNVVLFLSAVNAAPFDKQLLGCFMPSLQFVCGLGAGFDHGESKPKQELDRKW